MVERLVIKEIHHVLELASVASFDVVFRKPIRFKYAPD